MVKKYIPKRGDIVWLDFEPQKGKEIMKTRPALVISPEEYNNKVGLALFMPITGLIKNYPFEVVLKSKIVQGAILCDQIRSLDWIARKARLIDSLDKHTLQEVINKFMVLVK